MDLDLFDRLNAQLSRDHKEMTGEDRVPRPPHPARREAVSSATAAANRLLNRVDPERTRLDSRGEAHHPGPRFDHAPGRAPGPEIEARVRRAFNLYGGIVRWRPDGGGRKPAAANGPLRPDRVTKRISIARRGRFRSASASHGLSPAAWWERLGGYRTRIRVTHSPGSGIRHAAEEG